jgi:hypothetical protein
MKNIEDNYKDNWDAEKGHCALLLAVLRFDYIMKIREKKRSLKYGRGIR